MALLEAFSELCLHVAEETGAPTLEVFLAP